MDARILKGKIAEAGLTQGELARRVGMSQNTLIRKMKGRRDFTVGEALKICDVLHILDDNLKAQIFLH